MEMMKAGVYYGPRDIRVQDFPKPKYGPEGLLIKVKACGICNFIDMPAWNNWGGMAIREIGNAIGHEWSGEVVEVGSEVTGVKVGDKAYGHRIAPCYQCESCRVGEYHRCGNPFGGIGKTSGAFAEYISVHRVMNETGFVVYPQDMGFRDLSLVEPLELSVALARKAKPGELVVVLGLDFVALGTVAFLKERGAKIIAADISELRRNAAKEIGADIVLNPLKEDVIQAVMEETKGRGADIVLVIDERPIAVQQSMSLIKAAGHIWLTYPGAYITANPKVVSMHPVHFRIPDAGYDESPVIFDPSLFTMRTAWGTLGPYKERWLEGVRMLQTGVITAEKHVTHVFPLEKISEAFEVAANPYDSIKVVIEL